MSNETLIDIRTVTESPKENQPSSFQNKTYDQTNPLSLVPRPANEIESGIELLSYNENKGFNEILNRPLLHLADNTIINSIKNQNLTDMINHNGFISGFTFNSASSNQILLNRGVYVVGGNMVDFYHYVYRGQLANKTDQVQINFSGLNATTEYFIYMTPTGSYILDTMLESGMEIVIVGKFSTDGSGNYLGSSYVDLRFVLKNLDVSDITSLISQVNSSNLFKQIESGIIDTKNTGFSVRADDFIILPSISVKNELIFLESGLTHVESGLSQEILDRIAGDIHLESGLNLEIYERIIGDDNLQSQISEVLNSAATILSGNKILFNTVVDAPSEIGVDFISWQIMLIDPINRQNRYFANIYAIHDGNISGMVSGLESGIDFNVFSILEDGDGIPDVNIDVQHSFEHMLLVITANDGNPVEYQITRRVNGLGGTTSSIESGLFIETVERMNADSFLQNEITNETNARIVGDSTFQVQIDSLESGLDVEIIDRINNDNDLETQIDLVESGLLDEINTRTYEDSQLSGMIVTETVARTNEDNLFLDIIQNGFKDPTGFENNSEITSLNIIGNTLHVNGTYSFYYRGTKFTKTNDSIALSLTAGLHYVYYNPSGILVDSLIPIGFEFANIPVALIFYNSNTSVWTIGWEAHQTVMDTVTHSYLHRFQGTRYFSGLQISGFTLLSSSSVDNLTFAMTDGNGYDEDIVLSPHNASNPTNLFEQSLASPESGIESGIESGLEENVAKMPIWRLDNNQWTFDDPDGNGIYWKWTDSGRLNYNDISSSGIQSQAPSGNIVAYFVYLTNQIINPIQIVQGQRSDISLIDARQNATASSLLIPPSFGVESRLLYIVYISTDNSYAGTSSYGFVRLEAIDDFRTSTQGGGSAVVVGNHALLINLAYDTANHVGFGRLEYYSTTTPTIHNDISDTAGLGREFRTGDGWIDTVTKDYWKCVDSTANNAVWINITGEINVKIDNAINIGNGIGLFDSKVGTNLKFRSLKAGPNISIVQQSGDIIIDEQSGYDAKPDVLIDSTPLSMNVPTDFPPDVTTLLLGTINSEIAWMDDTIEEYEFGQIKMPPDLHGNLTVIVEGIPFLPYSQTNHKVKFRLAYCAVADGEDISTKSYTNFDSPDFLVYNDGSKNVFSWSNTLASLDIQPNDLVHFSIYKIIPTDSGNKVTGDWGMQNLRIEAGRI